MADDTPTLPGEWAELQSWQPDSLDQLQPVCLLHDLPLEEGSGSIPMLFRRECVVFWHWLRCAECKRPVALMNEIHLATACWYGKKSTLLQDVLERRQMELRYMTLLAYYQHLRNGWRVYDHSVAERMMPQPQTPEEMGDYTARYIEERGRVVQHG